MNKLLGFILVIWIISCGQDPVDFEPVVATDLSIEQIDSVLTQFNFYYENPIVPDSSSHVLIPISTELIDKRKKMSSDSYYNNGYPRYWNVLFYNMQNNRTRLLTDKKVRLSKIHVQKRNDEIGKQIMKNKVFYEMTNFDYNNDDQLNNKDPETLFSSEINGQNLVRISPKNEDLQYFEVISNSKQLLFKTFRDVNQDSVFNSKDESIMYKAELINSTWQIREIIDSTRRNEIKDLYFTQWLSKKE